MSKRVGSPAWLHKSLWSTTVSEADEEEWSVVCAAGDIRSSKW